MKNIENIFNIVQVTSSYAICCFYFVTFLPFSIKFFCKAFFSHTSKKLEIMFICKKRPEKTFASTLHFSFVIESRVVKYKNKSSTNFMMILCLLDVSEFFQCIGVNKRVSVIHTHTGTQVMPHFDFQT